MFNRKIKFINHRQQLKINNRNKIFKQEIKQLARLEYLSKLNSSKFHSYFSIKFNLHDNDNLKIDNVLLFFLEKKNKYYTSNSMNSIQ